MTRTIPSSLLTVVLLLAGCATPDPSVHRSSLSPRYADTDGDLLADPPGLGEKTRDPSTLIFAYTPVEDPAVYRQVWQGFLDHLEQATGKPVMFFPVQSNAAQIEAMRAGRLHVAGFNTGSVPYAVNVGGFHPVAMMASREGEYGYRMKIIVRQDSDIRSPEDLRGRRIAFTSPTSNSGYKAPTFLLADRFGLEEGEDYESTFSGKHDNSILGVVHGDYEAAAVAGTVLDQMALREVVDPSRLRTIYASDRFPTTAYGVAHDLEPSLSRKIREAFFTFEWEGSELLQEFGATEGESFIPVSYREHWQVIRDIDAAGQAEYR